MATRGSSAWRNEAWGTPVKVEMNRLVVGMAIYAGGPRFQCHPLAREAFTQLGAVFLRHSYIVRRCGGYNYRQITGGTSLSSHSWATSVDVNDDTNPYRRDKLVTDMPRAMILDVYAICTVAGVQVFRWGGDWDGRPEVPNSNYDTMHFEIIATPEELAAGFISSAPDPTMPVRWPVIRRGAVGPAVTTLQFMLGMERVSGLGTFGPRTEQAVLLYQRSRGLVVDGIVGAGTWTAILTQQPVGVSPVKIP